jgi:hypothetical protein
VKDYFVGTTTTYRAVCNQVPIDARPPFIDGKGAVPNKLEEAGLLFNPVFVPHRVPPQLIIVHKNPVPFLGNRVNDHVLAFEENSSHLGSIFEKGHQGLRDGATLLLAMLRPLLVIPRRGLLRPTELGKIPNKFLSLTVTNQESFFLRAPNHFQDSNPIESAEELGGWDLVMPASF